MHAHTAYRELLIANSAWQKELERVYGKDAKNARYDERGYATPELKKLKTAFLNAGKMYDYACR